MDITKVRLDAQHLSGAFLESPEAVVRHFGAVQAQDYGAALWGIGLRLEHATIGEVERSISERRIVRTWPLRGTIHFVPAEDLRWMVRHFATNRNDQFLETYLKKIGLTRQTLEACRVVLERELSGKALTRPEVYARLEAAGIEHMKEWGIHILGYWAQAGLLCIGPHRGKQPTVVLLDDWVPLEGSKNLSRDEALHTLTMRYFTGHGPATPHDLAWWNGLQIGEARRALERIAPQLKSFEQNGKTYWTTLEPPTQPGTRLEAHLLPPFDEYTVAFKDRSAALGAEGLRESRYGIFSPNLLVNGKILGAWQRRVKKNDLHLELMPTRALQDVERAALEEAAKRYARFFGLNAVTSVVSPVMLEGTVKEPAR
jgi:Winged helix DNA-binding domain